MACKAPGGKKKKYIYYKCKEFGEYFREEEIENAIRHLNSQAEQEAEYYFQQRMSAYSKKEK